MNELLPKFKQRMKIFSTYEDENLSDILDNSIEDIKAKCGAFDINENIRARELVFERSRYAYNDSLEFFDDNFLGQLQSLALELYTPTGDDADAV